MSGDLRVAVGIDAGWDAPTRAICNYRNKHVYPYLRDHGFLVSQVQTVHARYSVVAEITRTRILPIERTDLITGSGHGTPDAFYGWCDGLIFRNDDLPLAPVVHLLACSTAVDLGVAFANQGGVFFGYNDFVPIGIGYPAALEAVLECDAEIDRLLAEGLPAGEVYKRVTKKFDEKVLELEQNSQMAGAGLLETVAGAFRMVGDDGRRLQQTQGL